MQENKNFQIRFCVLQFTLQLLENAVFPERKEVVLRGGIGEMLLRQYCIRDKKCEECDFTNSCISQNFMYAKYKNKPDFVTTGESIGYVLHAEGTKTQYKRGEYLNFTLTLFGDTIAYLNPIIQTIYLLGRSGLGEMRAGYQIEAIRNRHGQAVLKNGSIYYKNCRIETLTDYVEERKAQLIIPHKIVFQTPLAVKYKSEFIKAFAIRAVLNSVTRRLYMLECFEGHETEEKRFYENLPEVIEQEAELYEMHRYSTRTKQYVPLKGIIGEMKLNQIEGEILDYLLAGEITHIGKNTRFGLGKYKVL